MTIETRDTQGGRGLTVLALAMLLTLFVLAAVRVTPLASDAARAAAGVIETVSEEMAVELEASRSER